MKSLERRFNNISEKSPNKGSYACFAEAVMDQGFTKQTVHRWFQKLVEKEDYAKGEKRSILKHLNNLSNPLGTTEIDQELIAS